MINMPMRAVADAFHEAWRLRWPFLVSRLVVGLVVLALLAPVISLALRAALALSGKPALSDLDIALFLLSPVGFVAALLVASLVLVAQVLNIAFMMAIALHARRSGERRFEEGAAQVLPRFGRLLGFAWRLLLRVFGIVLPFLIFGLLVAAHWLGDYDINYYLSQHPPEFLRTVAIVGIALAVMAVVLIRALLGWAVALPMVLFAGVHPSESFAASARAMQGRRLDLLLALLGWAAVSVLAMSVVLGVASVAATLMAESLWADLSRLAAGLAILLGLWWLANMLVTATTSGALANLLMERADWPGVGGVMDVTPRSRHLLRNGLILSIAGAAVLALLGGADLLSRRMPDKVEVIAHRGAAGIRPENTMAAFAQAIEDKADWVELDVQESAEGEIIVVHDSDFMKLAGVDLKAWDATADRLAEIDIGSWFGPDYAGERTPLLRDVLEMAKGTGSGVLIELKYYGHDEALEERVAALVEETGMVDQVSLMSLKYEGVQKMKALRPDWTVGLLAATSVGRLWELEADFLAVNAGMASATLVRRSRDAGKPLYVWTVDDPLAMSRMLSLGVDGLITDEPALAREVIAERAELSMPERLILALGSTFGLATSDKVYRDDSP
ncbi:glycerophosphodiester phosphodiesterase family protein [Tropicimonas sp. IMCC6043]|uniref:glycerophosphodiester phosphodiesterase family protein n=1 Tax=Tropicimonas sp. IMCC6043 TaxID=2510645 RepID=UPI001F5DBF9E|nr:glycerophosphodiester phosphodiesterase family protein [Tropicimonas sp. IMCC6043]